jgi:cardiolipin synthase
VTTFALVCYLLIPLAAIHAAGVCFAMHALLWSRTSQGAIAWALALILLPYLSLPLYLVLGRSHFRGYRETRNAFLKAERFEAERMRQKFYVESGSRRDHSEDPDMLAWERLFDRPFLTSNEATVLVDGAATFEAVEAAIAEARSYVLLQSYIIRDDEFGRHFAGVLGRASARGVRVYVLYDEVGCAALPASFLESLAAAGVRAAHFNTRKGIFNKFQLNFRNHRKIVVVDGRCGFVGGHNIGDEYLGRDERFGKWHDLHVRIKGPEVAVMQLTFLRDWFWATDESIEVEWDPSPGSGRAAIMTIPTGPVDEREKCSLMFMHAICSARSRIWIASPYFVPDDAVLLAMQLAAGKGVDVRLMIPKRPDHLMVWLASFAYLPSLLGAGARVYRYSEGFMHAKAFVLDDRIGMIGTPNLDNRSLRLNFEISEIIADGEFVSRLAEVFERDFECSLEEDLASVDRYKLTRKLSCRIARLLGPIL